MSAFKKQLDFVRTAEIVSTISRNHEANEPTIREVLDESKNQALVVGSEIISFASGVSASMRESITNSALLAQLVANVKVPDKEDVTAWYDVYFDSLQQLGWLETQRTFLKHEEKGTDFETHKAIIAVAGTVFGPAATAVAIITSTLTALQDVSGKNKKWLTIFKRESQRAQLARFQISVVEPTDEGGVSLHLMAFKLTATSTLTQVLFFKVKNAQATLEHASGTVTLSQSLLTTLGPSLAKKVERHAFDFIDSIGDIPLDV